MARKVFLLAVMGGAYPQGEECNLMGGMSNEHNHLVASAAVLILFTVAAERINDVGSSCTQDPTMRVSADAADFDREPARSGFVGRSDGRLAKERTQT